MTTLSAIEPIDYLAIGHLTVDITPSGPRLGGSVAYAALTARALGLRVGCVTTWGNEITLSALKGITVVAQPSEHSTQFENINTPQGRVQIIRKIAPKISFDLVPQAWRNTAIIHLAPVAQEIEDCLPSDFSPEFLGLTPQGWLRAWDEEGRVSACEWKNAQSALQKASAAVLSLEDVQEKEETLESFMLASSMMCVTEGAFGARLYWNRDLRRFHASEVPEVDATGAGDVFAAAFFCRLRETRDPWESARFASRVASLSVTRSGLDGIPTYSEIQSCLMEVIQ